MTLLLLLPAIVVLVPTVAGVALTVALSQIPPLVRFARSRGVLIAGRVAIGLLALLLLPGAALDLRDVVVRDGTALLPPG